MKNILTYFLLAILATNLSACGTKGKLKTPTQIAREDAKKAKKEAKKKEDAISDQTTQTLPQPNKE